MRFFIHQAHITLASLFVLLAPVVVHAQTANDPAGSFTEGIIYDVVHTNSGHTIVGGGFETVGPPMGKRVEHTALARGSSFGVGITDAAKETAGKVALGQAEGNFVTSVVGDGSGGLFMGGSFEEIDGVQVSHIAHIKSNGDVDAWNPGINDIVKEMLIYEKGANPVLVVSGEFTNPTGADNLRNYIAAYEIHSNGQISLIANFNPDPDNEVLALHAVEDTLFFGGDFTTLLGGGKPIDHVGAINMSDIHNPKLLEGFDPGFDNTVSALTSNGNTLFVGGSFKSAINGLKNIGYLAAFDISDPDKTSFMGEFNVGLSAAVRTLEVNKNSLYVGGDFLFVDGIQRTYLAAFNVANPKNASLLNFNPGLGPDNVAPVGGVPFDLDVYSDVLYVGGAFKHVASGAVKQKHLIAYDVSNPNVTVVMGNFTPNIPGVVFDVHVDTGSGSVLVGTMLDIGSYVAQENLAVFDSDGTPVTHTANVSGGLVSALELWETGNSTILYVAGSFKQATGASKDYLAAYFVEDDGTLELIPGFDLGFSDSIWSLKRMGLQLYVGGEFDTVNNQPRKGFAAINPANINNPTLLDFDPGYDEPVYTIAGYGDYLITSGVVNPGGVRIPTVKIHNIFDPNNITTYDFDGQFGSEVTALATDMDRLYVGGAFAHVLIDGLLIPRTLMAGFDISDPDQTLLLPGFNPSLAPLDPVNPDQFLGVHDFKLHDDVLYVSGEFDLARGEQVHNLVAYDVRNTSATNRLDFQPDVDGPISSVTVQDVGGEEMLVLGAIGREALNHIPRYDVISLAAGQQDNAQDDAQEQDEANNEDDQAQDDVQDEQQDQAGNNDQDDADDNNQSNNVNNNQVSDGSQVTQEEVVLQIDPPDGPEEPTLMAISNNPDFAGASFIPFARTADWVLPEGVGEKKIYIRFRYADGRTVDEIYTVQFLAEDKIEVSCPLTVGQAYKSPASAAVWFIGTNPDAPDPTVCYKRAFNHARTFFTYFEDWSVVKNTSQSKLNQIAQDPLGFMPAGPLYDPKFGALVKHPFDPKVYLILGDTKFWITSEEVFNTLNYQWNWIEDVHPDFLKKYLVGSEINYLDHHPNYTLVKYANNPKVYRLEPHPTQAGKQVKRYIPNEDVFNALQFRFDRIVTLDTSEEYEDGDDLISLN